MNNPTIHSESTGLCECGCGAPVPIAKRTDARREHIKGKPMRFIAGHQVRGARNPNWSADKRRHTSGYVQLLRPDHQQADSNGYIFEHHLVAERVLRRPLPSKAVVHHVNEICDDNRPVNLVICENDTYHKLLHQRARAIKACGHADWRKCQYCKNYGDTIEMYTRPSGRDSYHRLCHAQYKRQRT